MTKTLSSSSLTTAPFNSSSLRLTFAAAFLLGLTLLAAGCASEHLTPREKATRACNDDPSLKQVRVEDNKGLPPFNCDSLRKKPTTNKVPQGS